MSSLAHIPESEMKEILMLKERLATLESQDKCRESFMEYVRYIWDGFIEGEHHRLIADKLTEVAQGKCKRLIVNMPPRHTKSEFASVYFPSWIMGLNPDMKIMQTTHTADLSIRFGRKVRNLMDTQEYKRMFDNVSLAADSKSAGRWETSQGGEYFAAGVGGAITGRGADLLIIDDPHSEQDALSKVALEDTYEWYTSGPRQRLQPGGAIVIVMTRWNVNDLTGRLLKDSARDPKADQWEVIELPAILPSGKALWPEYWQIEELESVKASLRGGPKWHAQYMQNPSSEEGALIKREWWKEWPHPKPPQCDYIIQSYDTAFLKRELSDYSAITTWGVFYPEGRLGGDEIYSGNSPHIILLDVVKGKYTFPELKSVALDQYKHWEPDVTIIEAKASGLPLTQELRNIGIPVQNFTPSKGNDKVARVNACAPLFESGMVWHPDTKWATDVIEECAAFPAGDHDDLVDSTTQALMRFRQGGFVQLPSDYEEEVLYRKKISYY